MSDTTQTAFNLSLTDTYSVDWVHATKYTKDWNSKREVYRPNPSYIKEIMDYNYDTGKLYWKKRYKGGKEYSKFNSQFEGKEVRRNPKGGTNLKLYGRYVPIMHHHLVWCWHYQEWPDPDLVIDHINGDNTDNKITNLRLVTHLENHKNKKIASNNTSGHRGVSFCKRANKWKASIHVNQKKKHLGFFKNKEDAILVRQRAEKEYGYHENHGRLINGDS